MRGQSTEQSELLNGGEVEISVRINTKPRTDWSKHDFGNYSQNSATATIYRLSSPEHNYK